ERSEVEVERFKSLNNSLNGVHIAKGGQATLRDGAILGNFFGLTDQSDAFEVDTVQCVEYANCCGQSCDLSSAPNCNIESGEQSIPGSKAVLDTLPSAP
ncbi:MAG: hypothetical protein AAFS10_27255, partial [Myxococcota bacterium]